MALMESNKHIAATATMIVMAIMPSMHVNAEPKPVVMLTSVELPQSVPKQDMIKANKDENAIYEAVKIYHELRKSFGISHTTMADWLGVKRRTLYNWMNQATKVSRYGSQIESRLFQLSKFRSEIEPEHVKLVNKIAFSPIYGDPAFGLAIINGHDSDELLKWYDKLFSRFESYQSVQNRNDNLS